MKLQFLILGLMTFTSAFYAQAGGVDGGGGKSIVCRDNNGSIKSAEVLDLYEGRVMFGLNIIETNQQPMKEQIQKALNLVPPTSRAYLEHFAGHVLRNMRLTPEGTELLPIDDSFEVIVPKGCKAEQAVNYYNNNMILINSDIWNSLSETGKAALILHEGIYYANRLVGATNSRQSRHIIASIFDPSTQWVDIHDQLPQQKLACVSTSGGLLMWAFQRPDSTWMLQFHVLGNSYMMSKKTLTIRNTDIDLTEAKTFPVIKGDDLIGTGITTTGLAQSVFENNDVITISKKWEPIKDSTTGQIIKGYQTPRYYFSWNSSTFPKTSVAEGMLNCSVEMPQ